MGFSVVNLEGKNLTSYVLTFIKNSRTIAVYRMWYDHIDTRGGLYGNGLVDA